MAAIGGELRRRGHRVTLFPFPGFEDRSAAGDLDVWPVDIPTDLVQQRVEWISQAEKIEPKDFLRFAMQRARLLWNTDQRYFAPQK